MKNLTSLKGAKTLNKKEQKNINGGRDPRLHPCGDTGGMIVASHHCFMGGYGTVYANGQCWACY